MGSGTRWTERDLRRALEMLYRGRKQWRIAEDLDLHRTTVSKMIEVAALRYLARQQVDDRAAELDNLADPH